MQKNYMVFIACLSKNFKIVSILPVDNRRYCEYNISNIICLFQGEVQILTGGKEHFATSPRALRLILVRFQNRRYSPDERNGYKTFLVF